MDLKKLALDYIAQKQVMQFATSKDNTPRICSVHFAFDNELNLYWVSSRNSQHSQDLRDNKNTSAAILIDPDLKQCIHFQGEAFELQGDETMKADEVYGKRFGISKERLAAALAVNKNNPAYYLLKPKHMTIIDTVSFPDSPKQELSL